MHPLITLVFPDTVMAPQAVAQLLLFFEKIYHYLPAEPPAAKQTGSPPAADPYAEAGLCLGYPPVPVGEGLDRFWKTIRDLQANVNDYGHRLPFLSLASQNFRDSSDHDEKTVSGLASRLHAGQPGGTAAEADPDFEAELWKARIVLKLAEGLDAIEEEIEQGLAGLEDLEQEMLDALKGQEEEEEEMLARASLDANMPVKSKEITCRLKAWGRLFLAEQAAGTAPADYWLAATASPEAAQILFAAYATRFKQDPARLFALPLPALHQPATTVLEKRIALHGAIKEPRLTLHTFLHQIAMGERPPAGSASSDSALIDAINAWSAAASDHLDPSGPPQDHLCFYCFPQLSLPALFDLVFLTGCPGELSASAGRQAIITVLARGGGMPTVAPL